MKTYFVIFGALLLLTLTTVVVAGLDLGAWHTPVALGIAGLKATLVVLFFMHALHGSRLVYAILFSAVVALAIMLAFTMSDYMTRGWLPP